MKKYIGWTIFFLAIVGLAIGGYFIVANLDTETFQFKEVKTLDYNDFTLHDFVEQDIVCNDKACTFKDKDVIFTISEVKELGPQDVTLKLEYEGEKFEKTFHVDVVDKKNPEIVLNKSAIIVDLNEKIDTASYIAEVTDNYDTLSVDDIEIENNVDLKKAGDYEVVYTIQDSSGNIGKSVLKVKVKGEKEVISSSDDKKEEEVVEEKITLNYDVSGLFNDSGTLLQGKAQSLVNKNIELGWNNTLKITSKIDTSGTIRYIISKSKITGNELTPIGGKGFPVISGSKVSAGKEASFEYTFTEEGTYYVSIVVWDEDNDTVIKKDFCLNLSVSEEVKDMKIVTEDKGSYLVIDCDYIGGGDNTYYFVAAIADSDDPKALEEEIIVTEGNEIRIYYTNGYYYNIAGMLFTLDEELVMMKSIKVQK